MCPKATPDLFVECGSSRTPRSCVPVAPDTSIGNLSSTPFESRVFINLPSHCTNNLGDGVQSSLTFNLIFGSDLNKKNKACLEKNGFFCLFILV